MSVRLGFLYPGYAAEDDYPRMAERLDGVETVVVHTGMGADAHRVDALLEIGGPERLLPGVRELVSHRVEVIVWACTSGSFVFGWDGALRQVRQVTEACFLPASSTSFAFVEALRSLGVDRVAVAATYPDDIASLFEAFLATAGVGVTSVGAEGIVTAAEVGTLGRDRVLDLVTSRDHPDAQAVLVPDTALHTVAWIDEVEAAVGKPVLTANQVTMWEALRLAGHTTAVGGLGRLFERAA